MRVCTCKLCGIKFNESDCSASVHYSNPSDTCLRCDVLKYKTTGDYVQLENGEYIEYSEYIKQK